LRNNLQKNPINTLQQLMIITAEECGELTQRCSKIIRKYEKIDQIEEEQRIKLIEEVGDVLCMINLMVEHNITDWEELNARVKVKKDKLKIWSELV
tara:strand:- start:21640 stop:21927 length:288 start_codon:yes stop_codon:yes gene_type:complete